MAGGPQRARLDSALTGAHEAAIEDHSGEWKDCVTVLTRISVALATASPAMKEQIGGQTGPAIDAAFAKSAQGMQEKAEELVRGSVALQAAAGAIRTSRAEQQSLADHPLHEPGPYHPPVGPPTDQDVQAEADNRHAHAQYASAFADQERRAQEKADHMDKVFEHSTAVMKRIHKVPDDPPPHGGDPGGGTGGTGGGAPAPAHSPGAPAGGGGRPPQGVTYHPSTPHPGHPGPGYQPGPGGGTPPPPTPGTGGPQGGTPFDYTPGAGGSQVPVSPAAGGTSGGLSGTSLGVAGAAAGGIGGGALASGLAGGSIRGGATPVVASPGTAASGVRGIGATGRQGVSGALGRSGASAVSPGAGTAASSRGTATRGASSTAAGRGSRSGAGGRGAGGRGAGAGGTAGGRTGRRKDDEKGRKRDLFDTGDDWVDDEDAAPGIID